MWQFVLVFRGGVCPPFQTTDFYWNEDDVRVTYPPETHRIIKKVESSYLAPEEV